MLNDRLVELPILQRSYNWLLTADKSFRLNHICFAKQLVHTLLSMIWNFISKFFKQLIFVKYYSLLIFSLWNLFSWFYVLLKLYFLLFWLFTWKWRFFTVIVGLFYVSLSFSIESGLFLSIFWLLFEFAYWSLLMRIFSFIIFTYTIFSTILSSEIWLFFTKTYGLSKLRSIRTWILINKIFHFVIIS